mmetsp:Transcript_31860/g.79897  ORF Transcript_31860/g.79897 Transcript_31860/m.79897 type:complete len:230 (-) Transcript_31860:2653-3342(-)
MGSCLLADGRFLMMLPLFGRHSMAKSSVMRWGLTARPAIHGCARNASAVSRSVGSFFKHAARKSLISGGYWLGSLKVGGGSLPMAMYRRRGVMLAYGGSLSAIWISVIPNDQMSVGNVYGCPNTISGDRKAGVPVSVWQCSASPSWLDTPKSVSLAAPDMFISTFWPLMSRCTKPFSCRYARPFRMASDKAANSSDVNERFSVLRTFMTSPSVHSSISRLIMLPLVNMP